MRTKLLLSGKYARLRNFGAYRIVEQQRPSGACTDLPEPRLLPHIKYGC